MLCQLLDNRFYKETPTDLNTMITKEIKDFLELVKYLIPTNILKFALVKNWRTPLFYLLPKIHKLGNPGRPIVSQINSPTHNLSMIVDHYLKPFI